jgi:hypothetical protein
VGAGGTGSDFVKFFEGFHGYRVASIKKSSNPNRLSI